MSDRIRIAYLVTSLETGGTEKQLAALLAGLPDAQYEKHVVCLSGFGPLEPEFRKITAGLYDLRYPRIRKNGRIQFKSLPGTIPILPRLVRLLRQIKPDLLHTLIPVCNIIGSVAGKLARVRPIVCSKLSLAAYRDTNAILARFENWTDPLFDLVHCKSEGILRDVSLREPIDVDKLRIVYNGLRTENYNTYADRAFVRQRLGIPADAAVIGMVANLKAYKGHIDVIRAAPSIVENAAKAWFLFVGRDDGIQEGLKVEATSLGVADRIVFTGERNDVPDLLQAMDVLVSASHEEGFSNTILEGMATGLPVVATRVGGNPESVVDEVTGFLVPPHSPPRLAEAIGALLESPELARKLGDQGKRRVRELFSYQAMIRGMRNFYDEAIKITAI